MANYVDLSAKERSIAKKEYNKKSKHYTVAKKYRHLSFSQRAKQAAMDVSDNGRCWWVHNYVYASIIYKRSPE